MKKILLIIFLFFCCINVSAQDKTFVGSEYLTGISYMKYDGKTHYYRNAQVIREASTNEIAYCVEPFTLLVNNSSYISSDSFNKNFNIEKDKWELAKLIAYYGYGYKNHTDKKWISITQMTIWRSLYPNYQFDWIDNTTSKKIIYPYNNEIKELKELVDNHYKRPSFNDNYEFSINESIELIDENNVLNNYKIVASDFDIEINNEKLIINTGGIEKEGTITFEKKEEIYPNSVLYFYSSSSQNVIKRGNIELVNYKINIKVDTGKITINKIDNDNNSDISQGDASLDGAVFELYDENMNLLDEGIIVNNMIQFDKLSFGKYFIKEKKAGTGYYLNNKTYEVVIDNENLDVSLEIENDVIKSKIKIVKLYGTKEDYKKNKMKEEKGVSFDVYNNEEIVYSGVTDSNGTIELELPYGNYVIRQKSSTDGYQFTEDYYFSVNEESNHSIDIVLYDYKIDVYNAYYSSFRYLKESLCLSYLLI